VAPGGDDAERDRDEHGEQDRQRGQRQRRLEALGDERRHVHPEVVRLAEVAGEQLADPDRELDDERPVEAEADADRSDLLGVGGVAGEDRRRISRRQAQQQEYQDRDDAQDGNRREDPPGEEGDQFFLMFQ
jgi:hypothetical protein